MYSSGERIAKQMDGNLAQAVIVSVGPVGLRDIGWDDHVATAFAVVLCSIHSIGQVSPPTG